jgi:hypothetical protein
MGLSRHSSRSERRRRPQAPSLPVVIGSGSHPFPFRTRKLSLIPPMVLHGKLCGRVGRCRHYSSESPRGSLRGLSLCTPAGAAASAVSHAHGLSSLGRLARSAARCGRVGRCRHYSSESPRGSLRGLSLCTRPGAMATTPHLAIDDEEETAENAKNAEK